MRAEEFEHLDQLEDRMWWFSGLRGNVAAVLSQYLERHGALLDAGCGTGGMLHILSEKFPDAQLYGIDYSAEGCMRSHRKAHAEIQRGSISSLPYKKEVFDAIISLDVLEYDTVDVDKALREFQRCLKLSGYILLNLPAYQWMLSYHDSAVGQARRFSLRGLEEILPNYGFKVIYATYWNTIFFPLMVLRRKIFVRNDGGSDVKPFPPPIEMVFQWAMRIERAIITKRWRLPYGGSVMVLAQRDV